MTLEVLNPDLVRTCCAVSLATQRISTNQTFRGADPITTQTTLSPQPVSTLQEQANPALVFPCLPAQRCVAVDGSLSRRSSQSQRIGHHNCDDVSRALSRFFLSRLMNPTLESGGCTAAKPKERAVTNTLLTTSAVAWSRRLGAEPSEWRLTALPKAAPPFC